MYLIFFSIFFRQDNTVEISRKNGIPSYLKFSKNALLMSFVSALDGYYRLAVKWTFNLCGEIVTPSLERLHKLKCHGPVGYDFIYFIYYNYNIKFYKKYIYIYINIVKLNFILGKNFHIQNFNKNVLINQVLIYLEKVKQNTMYIIWIYVIREENYFQGE